MYSYLCFSFPVYLKNRASADYFPYMQLMKVNPRKINLGSTCWAISDTYLPFCSVWLHHRTDY